MTDSFWPILGLDEGASESDVRRAYAKQLRRQGADADVATFQALRAEFEAAMRAARSGSPIRAVTVTTTSIATQRAPAERLVQVIEPQPARDEPPAQHDDVPLPKGDDLRSQRVDLRLQSDDLRSQGDNLRLQSDDLRSQSDDLRSQSDDLRSKSDGLRLQSGDLRSQGDDLRSQGDDLRSQGDDLRSQSDDLRSQSDDSLWSRIRDEPGEDAVRIPERSNVVAEEIGQLLSDGDLAGACDRFDLARALNEINFSEESKIELELARHWLTNTTLDATALAAIVRRYRWDDAVSGFPLGAEIFARLQAEAKPVEKPVAKPVEKPGERFIGKWNWGAFCLTPFWLMAHGLRRSGIGLLALELVLLVVPLGPIAVLMIAIAYGRRGNALAVKHRAFTSEAQFVAVQNAWRNWGISLCACIPPFLLVLLAWIGAQSH
jgi:plasmid stabilization system protein ParE